MEETLPMESVFPSDLPDQIANIARVFECASWLESLGALTTLVHDFAAILILCAELFQPRLAVTVS